MDLPILRAQDHGVGGTEVGEFVDYLESVVADFDFKDMTEILCTHIGLFETQCEAKFAGKLVDKPPQWQCCLGMRQQRGQYRQRRACHTQVQF